MYNTENQGCGSGKPCIYQYLLKHAHVSHTFPRDTAIIMIKKHSNLKSTFSVSILCSPAIGCRPTI